jgi:hypothetical protein
MELYLTQYAVRNILTYYGSRSVFAADYIEVEGA